jgi:riboflavin biosynthesis pyrimidine reductase
MNLERLFDTSGSVIAAADLYTTLIPPAIPADRPYVYVNMVSTIDGKIVIGKPGGTAAGLGGPTDQALFRRVQNAVGAILIGASTVRAGSVIYPLEKLRFVVSGSGDLPLSNRFFTDAPDAAYVLAPDSLPTEQRERIEASTQLLTFGEESVDLAAALHWMRHERGVETLLCEGGASLNSQMLHAGLVDELFLTFAPKIKGGSEISTIVSGEAFPPGQFLAASLLSVYHDQDELYLRYRISPTSRG